MERKQQGGMKREGGGEGKWRMEGGGGRRR